MKNYQIYQKNGQKTQKNQINKLVYNYMIAIIISCVCHVSWIKELKLNLEKRKYRKKI